MYGEYCVPGNNVTADRVARQLLRVGNFRAEKRKKHARTLRERGARPAGHHNLVP